MRTIPGAKRQKARKLARLHGGHRVTAKEAYDALNDPTVGVVCVVRSPSQEVAVYCEDAETWNHVHARYRRLQRRYVLLPRDVAEQLATEPATSL
jgi:hypothetical protein